MADHSVEQAHRPDWSDWRDDDDRDSCSCGYNGTAQECADSRQAVEKVVPDGANLDLDFIDFPTGWAIQRTGLVHTDGRCSAAQTGSAMLCDCNALPAEWARLKAAHDGADGLALAARYMSTPPGMPTDDEVS